MGGNIMDIKLFAAFWTDIMDEIPGKKAFQKLVYFGQVLGIPFKQPYRMHYFGPYSDSVARELSRALEQKIVIQEQGYKFGTGETAKTYLEDCYDDVHSNIDNLTTLIEYFGDMGPMDLELYATTHYVDNNQKRLYGNYDKQSIIDKIKEIKGTKFTTEDIETAYNQLDEWDLLTQHD
jgi:hypothetical protein